MVARNLCDDRHPSWFGEERRPVFRMSLRCGITPRTHDVL